MLNPSFWIGTGPTDIAAAGPRYLCLRRSFRTGGGPRRGKISLTADARYVLYVNGAWVGQGPARAWPEPWPYDTYSLDEYLREGENVIAVLVLHPGQDTFQYLERPLGLLAELSWRDNAGQQRIITDETWRCRPHDGFASRVPRISVQQTWEEQCDARRAPGPGWKDLDCDDTAWQPARTLPRAQWPHTKLEPRTIPFLTAQPLAPQRLVAAEIVRCADKTLGFDLRLVINSSNRSSNYVRADLIALTHIQSPRAQTIELHYPGEWPLEWKLNGQLLKFEDHALQHTQHGISRVRIPRGTSCLMARHWPFAHARNAAINIWSEQPLQCSAWPDKTIAPTEWLGLGPFELSPAMLAETTDANVLPHTLDAERITPEATWQQAAAIWERGHVTPAELSMPFTAPLPQQAVAEADVYAQCASERVLTTGAASIDQPEACLHDSPDWTVIHPCTAGDVRLLFDFGREVIGYHEFTLEAPAGTIVDNHNFEFIQPDGRHNLAELMNNSFRYICREGVQTYRTLVRRGFRYSWFTFRNMTGPVRLRQVRLLHATYPQARRGSFACSDTQLDRIWQAGAESLECCSEDTYTDCPTYEQTFWVGDGRNESLVDLMINGDPRLSRHAWFLVAGSLRRSPITEALVPTGWQILLPAWTFLWMRWAGEYYMLTGERETGLAMLEALQRNFEGLQGFINADDLLEITAWNLFDWAGMDTPAQGIITHQNCLAVLALEETAALARALGRPELARLWSAQAARMRRAINKHLWDATRRCYIDCIHADGTRSKIVSQQTQTAAYIARVPEGERATRCRKLIETPPKGYVRAGSPFFMFFMLEALEREGAYARLIDTIRSYWGPQIAAGATTFWEQYHADAERMTRSHCHAWSAAPTYYLSKRILGVLPLQPGYAKILIAPHTVDLSWARGTVPTPHGDVYVYWQRTQTCFSLHLDLPAGIPTELELPVQGTLIVHEGKAKPLTGKQGEELRLKMQGRRVRLSIEMKP